MATIGDRLLKLERMKGGRLRRRDLCDYTDTELEAVLIAAGIDPRDDAQMAAAARGEDPHWQK